MISGDWSAIVKVLAPAGIAAMLGGCAGAPPVAAAAPPSARSIASADVFARFLRLTPQQRSAAFATLGKMSLTAYFESELASTTDAAISIDGTTIAHMRSWLTAGRPGVIAAQAYFPLVEDYWHAVGFDPKLLSASAFRSGVTGILATLPRDAAPALDLVTVTAMATPQRTFDVAKCLNAPRPPRTIVPIAPIKDMSYAANTKRAVDMWEANQLGYQTGGSLSGPAFVGDDEDGRTHHFLASGLCGSEANASLASTEIGMYDPDALNFPPSVATKQNLLLKIAGVMSGGGLTALTGGQRGDRSGQPATPLLPGGSVPAGD